MRQISHADELADYLQEFDEVVLTMPLGTEGAFHHRDMLGLGNQIATLVAALCLAPEKTFTATTAFN